jgi:hypothetical protein
VVGEVDVGLHLGVLGYLGQLLEFGGLQDVRGQVLVHGMHPEVPYYEHIDEPLPGRLLHPRVVLHNLLELILDDVGEETPAHSAETCLCRSERVQLVPHVKEFQLLRVRYLHPHVDLLEPVAPPKGERLLRLLSRVSEPPRHRASQ